MPQGATLADHTGELVEQPVFRAMLTVVLGGALVVVRHHLRVHDEAVLVQDRLKGVDDAQSALLSVYARLRCGALLTYGQS